MKTHVDIYPEAHVFVKCSSKQNCQESSTILEMPPCFPKRFFPFTLALAKRIPVSNSGQYLLLSNFCRMNGKQYYLFVVVLYIFQVAKRFKGFSYISHMYWISSFVKHLFFCYLFYQVAILSLICRISLYVLDTSPFPILFITNITSHSLVCLLTLLVRYCDQKDVLIFNIVRLFRLHLLSQCFQCPV